MKKFLASACATLAGFSLMANAAFATTILDFHRANIKPMFVTPPHHQVLPQAMLDRLAASSSGLPIWQEAVQSPLDGNIYPFEMVGTNPFKTPAATTIPTVPIYIKVVLPDGNVLNPGNPGCGDTHAVESRFFNGPLFHKTPVTSNGIQVGPAQLTDAFQRANWWGAIKGSPNYHVNLISSLTNPIIVTYYADSNTQIYGGVCSGGSHEIAAIDINTWDNYIQTLVNKYSLPNQLPTILSYNVFQTEGGQCCILGYHNAYPRNGAMQTYAVAAYNDAQEFNVPIEDIHAWSHEIGEWMDDPFVQVDNRNYAPAYGNIGQISGCQNNLEVGDPLTGTPYEITFGGFTYHPQELVFFNWFYRTKSMSTGGKASFEGSFTAGQSTVCQ